MAKGMFVDTSICTGCKACQVACKEWNDLAPEPSHFRNDPVAGHIVAVNFTGNSYDNTGRLSATDWRHVRFIEQFLQALHRRWLPERPPDQRHRPHRHGQRLCSRDVHRLQVLHPGVSVRRDLIQ
jgi:hypothetical protein